jgi:hypothetical protein
MALWVCPKCGAKLVSRNLSHSCGKFSVEKFLEGASDEARKLFKAFERAIAACGAYDVAPAKTRVAFMARVRFASVNRFGEDFIDVHLVLPRKLESARFRRVEKVGNLYVHHARLSSPRELNAEFKKWLEASYVEYGQRHWLKKH